MTSKVKLSGVGCSLADTIYGRINFNSEHFRKYLSKRDGDGGLAIGRLVFSSDLAEFAGRDFQAVLDEIIQGAPIDNFNVGGPAVVGLINAAQLLHHRGIEVDFHGAMGCDANGEGILQITGKTPLNTKHYLRLEHDVTPFSVVLSDPDYHDGKGERTFINCIGAAGHYTPGMIDESFYGSDVIFYGATALVPQLHDNLSALLDKSRRAGCLNVVGTVFDFRNEKLRPGQRWPLGESDQSYADTHLLIVDWDEALKLSGENDFDAAFEFFKAKGVSALIVTHGAHDFYVWSSGRDFKAQELRALPICALVSEDMKRHPETIGDTTGCGDNFAGGILGSLCMQLQQHGNRSELDLIEACCWGTASGGQACFSFGGTYLENAPNEKYAKVKRYADAYKRQIGIK